MGRPLTPRLAQVLDGLERGLEHEEIAAELGISRSTVRNHCQRLYERMDASGREEAVAGEPDAGYLAAIDVSLRRLIRTLEKRGTTGLTPAQREVVHAFDRILAGFPAAEGDYRRAVDAVIAQAGINPSGRGRPNEALARLIGDIFHR